MVIPVSLVTTIYNRERYLSEAIESVLTQTYPDFELLLWDDGSTDDSLDIAYHYAAQDARIRVVAAPHQGRSPALKAAMAASMGTYVGWVDSDDLLSQTALAETVAVLEQNSKVGLVYTDYWVIDEKGEVIEYGQRCRTPYSKERLLLDFMVFHFRLMRRSIYEQVGGVNELFVCNQDFDLCLKISEVTDILHLKRPLYYYRYHKESISSQQRVEQILCAKEAIEQALQRRGMADEYELEVQIYARCSLLRKTQTALPKTVEAQEFTDWALSPQVLTWLHELIETHSIQSVVECGSGLSTMLFASLKLERVLTLEHDVHWYSYTKRKLEEKGLLQQVDLQLCPLEQVTLGQTLVQWYALSQIQPFSADLILVDGPPATSDRLTRYPAPYLLSPFIQAGTWLLLDDYHRAQETKIVERWLEELPQLELMQVLPLGKGLALLRFS